MNHPLEQAKVLASLSPEKLLELKQDLILELDKTGFNGRFGWTGEVRSPRSGSHKKSTNPRGPPAGHGAGTVQTGKEIP